MEGLQVARPGCAHRAWVSGLDLGLGFIGSRVWGRSLLNQERRKRSLSEWRRGSWACRLRSKVRVPFPALLNHVNLAHSFQVSI